MHVTPIAGTPASLNTSPAAIETAEPYEPRTTDTPEEIRLEAAVTPLALSDSLSTISSSTLYNSPPISTSGVTELAYWIPKVYCLPPAPLSPDAGSNTPILTVPA